MPINQVCRASACTRTHRLRFPIPATKPQLSPKTRDRPTPRAMSALIVSAAAMPIRAITIM